MTGRNGWNGRSIETAYAGHDFRSRLEARWAVFMDGSAPRTHPPLPLPRHRPACTAPTGPLTAP